mmetsp:Transcript_42030/g.129897  ORF Transcript_42030/g.129897 Transcript_42030/m.129897 type:complete len:203 (+) Transcript_42030:350-958(+)
MRHRRRARQLRRRRARLRPLLRRHLFLGHGEAAARPVGVAGRRVRSLPERPRLARCPVHPPRPAVRQGASAPRDAAHSGDGRLASGVAGSPFQRRRRWCRHVPTARANRNRRAHGDEHAEIASKQSQRCADGDAHQACGWRVSARASAAGLRRSAPRRDAVRGRDARHDRAAAVRGGCRHLRGPPGVRRRRPYRGGAGHSHR